ncbi:MAG TPA: hypothetical protein VGN57_02455 [Pirellulaceae bacterium]|jgi:hypothetical protein|nr:hypothetical protein [Pirellulaceae bacterium]
MLTERSLHAAIIVFTTLALAGCGGGGHGGHADSGHGASHGGDSGHGGHSSHDSHSSHGSESSHGGHGADSHGGHGAEATASHGPTDEELETGIAFIARPRQLVEVDLGEVFVTLRGPDETTYLFESQIYGLVDEGHLTEFEHALAKRREAMREALRSTIAKSETKDLFDPKLAGVKITLAAVARKTLGSPHLYDILFSNLSIEQD